MNTSSLAQKPKPVQDLVTKLWPTCNSSKEALCTGLTNEMESVGLLNIDRFQWG